MKKVLDRIGNSDYFLKRLWFCLLCVAVLSNVQAQETYIVKYHSTGGKTFPKVTSAKGEVTSTATVSLVGAGGAGGTGTGTNNGAGGGGGGASVTVAGYDVKNYTFPMNIGAGSSGAGQATTIGSPVEATAKGGSAGTHQSYGNGGSASSTGTISSNYGSNVRIISSYSGGYGGSAANGSTPDAGAGGSGGGISASGRSGGNGGTGIHVGASGGSAPDKFAGNGGSGANCLTLLFFIVTDGSSGASGGGGGGGGVRAIDSNQWYYGNPGSGGNGRVWVHFEYTYTGQNPQVPTFNANTKDCIATATLNRTLTITNFESDVEYTWYASADNQVSDNDTIKSQGTGSSYQHYTITQPGHYYVVARRLDPNLPLSYFAGATEISPYPFGSKRFISEVTTVGMVPSISNLTTTFHCGTTGITSADFIGIIPIGTVYTWDNPLNPAGVQNTTSAKSKQTSFTSGALLNLTADPATVTYTITPSYTSGSIECVGNPFTVAITVPPAGLSLNVVSSVSLCPDNMNSTLVSGINLYNYVTSYEGILKFYEYSSGGNTILNPSAYSITGSQYVYAEVSNAGGCKMARKSISLQTRNGIQAEFAWNESHVYTTLCPIINLNNLVRNTAASSSYNFSLTFYDERGEIQITDPVHYNVAALPADKRIVYMKIKNASSGCEYMMKININWSDPSGVNIPTSNQTLCTTGATTTVDLVHSLTSPNWKNEFYHFYSDSQGTNKLFSYSLHSSLGSTSVQLPAGSTTTYYVGIGCDAEGDAVTALTPFTVTVQPLPVLNITGELYVCSGQYVNLTSVVGEIPDSRCGITQFKYVTTSGSSSTISKSSAANYYIYEGCRYYVTVRDTATGCNMDFEIPVRVLSQSAHPIQTITVPAGAATIDLTQGINENAIPLQFVSFYSVVGLDTIPALTPQNTVLPADPYFLATINQECYSDVYYHVPVRFLSNTLTVRDSTFCATGAVSFNLMQLIGLPENLSTITPPQDTLKIYKNGALLFSTSSWTSALSVSCDIGVNRFEAQLASNRMLSEKYPFRITPNQTPFVSASNKIYGKDMAPQMVNLTELVTTTAPVVRYYQSSTDNPEIPNPFAVLVSENTTFYVITENDACSSSKSFQVRFEDPAPPSDLTTLAVQDTILCSSSTVIYPLQLLKFHNQLTDYQDTLRIFSDATGVTPILMKYYNYTSTSSVFSGLYYLYGKLNADTTVYVQVSNTTGKTELLPMTIMLVYPTVSVKSLSKLKGDAPETDLTEAVTAFAPAGASVQYYTYANSVYTEIIDPKAVPVTATTTFYARATAAICNTSYMSFQVRVVDLSRFIVSDTTFCSTTNTIYPLSYIQLPTDLNGSAPYSDTLHIYSDAAGTQPIGTKWHSWATPTSVGSGNAYVNASFDNTTTVYVKLSIGAYSTELKPLKMTVNQVPVLTVKNRSFRLNEGLQTVDLTTLATANPSSVTIKYYTYNGSYSEIQNPQSVAVSANTVFYARAESGTCESAYQSIAIRFVDIDAFAVRDSIICSTATYSPSSIHPWLFLQRPNWLTENQDTIKIFNDAAGTSLVLMKYNNFTSSYSVNGGSYYYYANWGDNLFYVQLSSNQLKTELLPMQISINRMPSLSTQNRSFWKEDAPQTINLTELTTQSLETGIVKYFSKNGSAYSEITQPESMTVSSDATFYARLETDACASTYLPIQIRFLDRNELVVRDTTLCSTSSTVNLLTLIQLPKNLPETSPFQDTLYMYSDAAGQQQLLMKYYSFTSTTSVTSGSYHLVCNFNSTTTVYVRFASNRLRTELIPMRIFVNQTPAITSVRHLSFHRGAGSQTVDLTKLISFTPASATAAFYSKSGDDYSEIVQPSSVTVSSDSIFYAQLETATCSAAIEPIRMRFVDIDAFAVRDSSICSTSASTYIYAWQYLKPPSWLTDNQDTIKIFRNAAGTDLLLMKYNNFTSYSSVNGGSDSFNTTAFGNITLYVQLSSNQQKTALLPMTIAVNQTPNVVTKHKSFLKNDSPQSIDLSEYVVSVTPAGSALKYYNSVYSEIQNISAIEVSNDAVFYVRAESEYGCLSSYHPVSIHFVDMDGFATRDTVICSNSTSVNIMPLMALPSNLLNTSPYQDTLKIFRDAAGVQLYGQKVNSWTSAYNINCNYGDDITIYVQLVSNQLKTAILPIHITNNLMPTFALRPQSIRKGTPTVNLTTSVSAVNPASAQLKYYTYSGDVYSEILNPNAVSVSATTTFYIQATTETCSTAMTAVQVRVIDTNQFSVRDTSFCSPTATTAVNVLGLVRLPDNITSVPPYQDTLKIFRDAAGTSLYAQRINSWTVAWNISCHYGDTTVYLQLCSGAIKSAVLPIHITINPMPVGPTPNYYLWRPGGEHPSEMSADELRDWNDLRNWAADDGSEPIELPSSISAVYIAGTDWTAGTPLEYFPDLTNINDAICQDIFFAHGAELTRPDKLDYQRAYVSLNFGLKNSSQKKNIVAQDTLATLAFLAADALTRNQWHLLTAPLGDMVTGDYAFGGYPATYLRKFSASATTSGSALVGNWSNYFTSNNETLRAGEGFVLHVNDYRDQTLFREYGSGVDTPVSAQSREYGLKQANGLLVFPYFDHKNWSDAHRIHTYDADQKTSRFYGIHDKQVDLPLLNSYATKERTEKANRFVFESTADHPNVSYSVTAGDVVWADDIHHFAMVGNPYLSSIDFDQFHEDNKEIIKNGFYLFVGDKYETYSPEGSDLNKFIAPMQSFLVEMQDAVSTGDLKFNVANISVPRDEATTLRSSRPTHNRMKVTLSNLYGESNTYLATRDYGMPTADRHDLTKLLSGIKASPEVYTLKNIKQSATRKAALANQVLPNGQTLVPLGIATSHEGKMRFDFSGMDSYNADIRFIDNGLQKEIDISGKDAFDYEFAYTPSVDNQGKVLADENRFFLRISGIIDGIDDVSKYEIIIYDTPNNIGVMASNDNPIRNLIITDAQGRILYCDDKVDAAFAQVRKTNELPSVFLVKVVTEYSTKTQKLITK